ncbi:MAG: hypothetical protein RBS95_02865 [Desulfobulbus sp.]|jgi:hypothetical protein|nr:hypothetical protein [Desulfobulbus sp.]
MDNILNKGFFGRQAVIVAIAVIATTGFAAGIVISLLAASGLDRQGGPTG